MINNQINLWHSNCVYTEMNHKSGGKMTVHKISKTRDIQTWEKQQSQVEHEENSIEKHIIAIREKMRAWTIDRFKNDIVEDISLINLGEYK